jgi:hypothetical protein
MMHLGRILLIAFLIAGAQSATSENKPTSFSDARAAVESNLRTPEGKSFDEQMGNEFVSKHLGPFRQCKQTAGDDLRNFWILLKLDKDGSAHEILLYPETKLGSCARDALLKDKFLPPPQPAYWVSVYFKITR